METIKDIAAEMREFADAESQSIGRDVLRRRIQHFADRIERSVTNCNQLKMREAIAETEKRIDKVISILTEIPDSCGYGGLLEDAADELCDLKEEFVKPALSKPPRNCDLYSNKEEAKQAWSRQMYKDRTTDLKYGDWLFTEVKGETK